MELILTLIALIIPSATGTALVCWVLKGTDSGAVDRLVFGYGAGLGLLVMEIFLIGLLRIPFSAVTITIGQVILFVIFLFLSKRARGERRTDGTLADRGSPPHSAPLTGLWTCLFAVMALWVAAKVGFVFYETFSRPLHSWDTWGNWSAGAKAFFYAKGLILEPTAEDFFAKGYRAFLGHPLHSPLVQVWISLWLGKFSEIYVKGWTFFYFLTMLGMVYSAVRRESDIFWAMAAVFFMASMPLLTYHGQDAYSDFPLSWHALAGALLFWRFTSTEQRRYLGLAGLFTGIGMTVKNEGLFFLIALSCAIFLYSFRSRKDLMANFIWFLVPVALMAGPWYLFKAAYGFGFGHSGEESGYRWLSDPKYGHDAPREVHWDVIPSVLREMFMRANFGLLFSFWAALSVLGHRHILGTTIRYLYVMVFLVMAMFLFLYLTLEHTTVIEVTGINRNMLTYVPIVFFTTAFVALKFRKGSG